MNDVIYRIVDIREKKVVYIGHTGKLSSGTLTTNFKNRVLKMIPEFQFDSSRYIIDWIPEDPSTTPYVNYMKALKLYQPVYCSKTLIENAVNYQYPEMTDEERKRWKPFPLYYRNNGKRWMYDGFHRILAMIETMEQDNYFDDEEMQTVQLLKEMIAEADNAFEELGTTEERFRKKTDNKILSSYPEDYYRCIQLLRESYIAYFEEHFNSDNSHEINAVHEKRIAISHRIPQKEEQEAIAEVLNKTIQALEDGINELSTSIATSENLLKTMNLLLSEIQKHKNS